MSGKHGYHYHHQDGALVIDRDSLERIIMTEDEFRLSDEWQKKFAQHDTNEWRVQVCHELQMAALYAHGIEDPAGLITIRNHRREYQNDDSFYKPVYVKYDRSTYIHWSKASDGTRDGDPEGDEIHRE